MAPRSPTLQDIANAAKVGKTTVSLALRNDPRLRPETRERIQAVALEMGYRANATVAALMAELRASRTATYQATLGLINASSERDWLKTFNTFRAWITGALRRATQLGYGLDDFWLFEPGISPGRLASILTSRNIRGVVIAGVMDHHRLPPGLEEIWKRFPCVVLGVRVTQPALHCATNDQYATALDATEQVLKLGYRRPGLVVETQVDANVDSRFSAGFAVVQNRLPRAQRLPVCDFDRTKPAIFEAWFKKHRPDVILGLHEEVKDWLAAMKVRVPRDVGLVHLDRTVDMEGWTGMNQSNDLVGMTAIDIIVGQIHRNEVGIPPFARSLMVESAWVAGATVRPQS
jgi:DNA-binding LacI/PurR family transcriptional regulator